MTFDLEKTYLHGNQAIIHENFLGEEVSTDSSFIAPAEFLVDLFYRSKLVLRQKVGSYVPTAGG